jgi:hypothetical protein
MSRASAAEGPAPRAAERSTPAPRLAPWLGMLAIAGAFAALARWTWGIWPDPIVDFGRELYVPWRIVEGEALYRDLAYFNGPLSPHVDALAFRAFGVGLSTLVWLNLALLAAAIALLRYLLRPVAGELASTAACVAFLACCGFGQAVGIGNYNWIAPYSHEATHGVLLGLASLAALQRWRDRGRGAWVAVSGACVGLALLTKPETFLAAAASSAVAIVAHARRERGELARLASMWVACALAVAAAAVALLGTRIGLGAALDGALAAYRGLVESDVASLAFYRSVMGTDDPSGNAGRILAWTGGAVGVLAPALALGWWAPSRWPRWLAPSIAAAATGAILAFAHPRVPWLEAGRPLPLAALAIGASAAAGAFRRREPRAISALALATFALALLAKVALNARLIHYGFALAGPALALAVAVLAGTIPRCLDKRGRGGASLRAGALALAAALGVAHLETTALWISRKPYTVGEGADAFRADVRGDFVGLALRWIRQRHPDGAPRPTLAVVPEGVTLNYLARLDNPTPYFNFMPPEIALFGERAMLDAFRASPPDLVLVVHKDTGEYGFPYFGSHYATELAQWLRDGYQAAQVFGDPPLVPGSRFGIAVLQRKR